MLYGFVRHAIESGTGKPVDKPGQPSPFLTGGFSEDDKVKAKMRASDVLFLAIDTLVKHHPATHSILMELLLATMNEQVELLRDTVKRQREHLQHDREVAAALRAAADGLDRPCPHCHAKS